MRLVILEREASDTWVSAGVIGAVLCLLIYDKTFFRGENEWTFALDLNTPETRPRGL